MQNQPDRLDRIEATLDRVAQQLDNQVMMNAELKQSVSALVETANIHQQGLELLAREMREQRAEIREQHTDISQLQEFQRTTSAALDRISAVLDYLVRQDNQNLDS
ncbi:hypothetical protein [Nostoc sp. WHI]|uniref:hypothetical protein n=1 Tax=Nostoc sp. WHI TaxID=2650611 RepID=UPI001E3A2592|nr:hypothetical protein [Nostoc sp. WHI]